MTRHTTADLGEQANHLLSGPPPVSSQAGNASMGNLLGCSDPNLEVHPTRAGPGSDAAGERTVTRAVLGRVRHAAVPTRRRVDRSLRCRLRQPSTDILGEQIQEKMVVDNQHQGVDRLQLGLHIRVVGDDLGDSPVVVPAGNPVAQGLAGRLGQRIGGRRPRTIQQLAALTSELPSALDDGLQFGIELQCRRHGGKTTGPSNRTPGPRRSRLVNSLMTIRVSAPWLPLS